MKVITAVINLDVDLHKADVRDKQIVLSGFAGLESTETQISPEEVLSLIGLLCRFPVIWLLTKTLARKVFRFGERKEQ